MKKRILPALLALCMVMSLLPTMVFAVETAAVNKCTCDHGGADQAPSGCLGQPTLEEGTDAVTGKCDVCKANATCNPCTKKDKGCTLAVHEEGTPHTGATECTNDSGCPIATTGEHEETCPNHACGFGGEGGKCTLKYGHETGDEGTAHNNRVCAGSDSSGKCGAASHTGSCDLKCACTNDAHGQTGCTSAKGEHTVSEAAVCDACYKNPACNPCEKKDEGCTLYGGHPGAHNGAKCTGDTKCVAAKHNAECPLCCGYSSNLNTNEGKTGVDGCTLTYGHSANHNTDPDTCTGDAWCPAKVHDDATWNAETETLTKACPKWTPCTLCVPTTEGSGDEAVTTPVLKCAGHAGNHNNTVCLGYKGTIKCGATTHIAGCPLAKCDCQGGELAHPGCTGEAGCPVCAAMENCDCPVCRANPGLGVVTDNEGNEVDPAEPTEPTVPEVPEKAADFTDIDGDDAGQEWLVEAVQTMLDNGWMQGVGGSKFEPGVEASTGMVLTVVARMYGEKGVEGTDYANLAKAWAEKNDLAEGIDLESDTIARKDIILLLWRLAGKTDSTQALEFTDVEGLEGDYLTALKWAVEKGIVKGNGDGTVSPDGILTRGQLAALVARYADNVK